MKRALVCGAGGFIGFHLVNRLKKEGYWVRGVDLKKPEFAETSADDFQILDLRLPENCEKALTLGENQKFDEVYQLAADMGGMGFIHSAECEIMHNNVLINVHMTQKAIEEFKVPNYFYSSSACVYRDMDIGEPALKEEEAYPAMPDNEYGWEKLYSERIAMAYGRKYGTKVSIARFQNTYGPLGTWEGGREKAPAALSRKVAEVEGNEGEIEIWGDGTAVRSYIFVDDLVDGIFKLVHSELEGPTNIGSPEYVDVNQLVQTIASIAKKKIKTKSIEGPIGVKSRNFSDEKLYSIGWKPVFSLEQGIEQTYPWVEEQVKLKKKKKIT